MDKRGFSLLEKWLLIPFVWLLGLPLFILIVGSFWTQDVTTEIDGVETTVQGPSGWVGLLALGLGIWLTVKIAKAPRKNVELSFDHSRIDPVQIAGEKELGDPFIYPRERMTGLEKVFGVSATKKRKWESAVRVSLREEAREAEIEYLKALAEVHKDALLRNWHKHVHTDEYGTQHLGEWSGEVQRFLSSVGFSPQVIEPEFAMVFLTDFVGTHASGSTDYSVFDLQEVNDAWDFEQLCAEELNGSGWSARVTQGSGDQGIDVLAEKDGISVVIQCKLYGKPVGNKAVQEAIAGKSYEKADYAAVVAPNGYTTSAKSLAQRANVLLLSPQDLRHLELYLDQ